MDGDEGFVLIFGLAMSGVFGFKWYARLARGHWNGRILRSMRRLALLTPPLVIVLLACALWVGAAVEVRTDFAYVVLFVALGGAWMVGAALVTALLGVHVLDDAIERGNWAAALAGGGSVLAMLLAYGFANLGEGPTIWTTIGPALLASVGCGCLWLVHQCTTDAADAITIGRDAASGVRFGGMALATGLILGRAVAGDWESTDATLHDFLAQGWPASLVVLVAAWLQKRLGPTAAQPHPAVAKHGVAPALGYLGLAALDLVHLGSWSTHEGGGR